MKYLIKQLLILVIGLVILFYLMCLASLLTDWNEEAYAGALDRCEQYVHMERTQHWKYFGLTFPYHYGVGQIRQESACRADAVAFDGGMGLMQVMPKTQGYIENYIGQFDPYNPNQAIRAQAWYMYTLHKSNFEKDKALWVTYMFYNSGQGTVTKEYKRAGQACFCHMREVCKRKVITLKSGQLLDLCTIGYEYPIKVYNYGLKYKVLPDGMRYW